jgi:hypothetical protein
MLLMLLTITLKTNQMTPKKDWTQQERDRFEKVFCAVLANAHNLSNINNTSDVLTATEEIIELLDNHYQNTSNEQSTNNN